MEDVIMTGVAIVLLVVAIVIRYVVPATLVVLGIITLRKGKKKTSIALLIIAALYITAQIVLSVTGTSLLYLLVEGLDLIFPDMVT